MEEWNHNLKGPRTEVLLQQEQTMFIEKTMTKDLATDPLISNNYLLAISLVFD